MNTFRHGTLEVPAVCLRHEGAEVWISRFGAQVLTWRPAGEVESLLYCSPLAQATDEISIRAGMPVVFPQFNAVGPGRRHGTVRHRLWEIDEEVASLPGRCTLRTGCDDAADGVDAAVALEVSLSARALHVSLRVEHRGADPRPFGAALHTYFSVGDSHLASIEGLEGQEFLDYAGTARGVAGVQAASRLDFPREVDRIYVRPPEKVWLVDGARRLAISQSGFGNAVAWNPGAEKGAVLRDVPGGGERGFLCYEAAHIYRDAATLERPVLLPGQHWCGEQRIELEP